MRVNINEIRTHLQQLEQRGSPTAQNVVNCAEELATLIQQCEGLPEDQEISKRLCRLADAIYAMRDRLPTDRQKQITQIFWKLHHIDENNVRTHLNQQSPKIIREACLDYLCSKLDDKKALSLCQLGITDDDLRYLARYPIKALDIRECPLLTRNCLPIIGSVDTLSSLQIGSNDSWLDDQALTMIPKNITTLSLAGTGSWTKTGLANLEGSHVTALDLSWCYHLNDEDAAEIPDQFEALNFSYCDGIGTQTLKRVGQLTRLRRATFAYTNASDEQVRLLQQSSLEQLDLAGTKVTDNAIPSITEIRNLKILSLFGCRGITDTGVRQLKDRLESLLLSHCPITSHGVAQMATWKKLRYLGLHGCDGVSDDTVKALQDANITVGRDELQPSNMARKAFAHLKPSFGSSR